jgi:hypothetical protein
MASRKNLYKDTYASCHTERVVRVTTSPKTPTESHCGASSSNTGGFRQFTAFLAMCLVKFGKDGYLRSRLGIGSDSA